MCQSVTESSLSRDRPDIKNISKYEKLDTKNPSVISRIGFFVSHFDFRQNDLCFSENS